MHARFAQQRLAHRVPQLVHAERLADQPDARLEQQFRGRHELIVREIEATNTWVEIRMLDELREVFFATLNKLHDVNNTVALVLRLLGEKAPSQ